VETTVRLPIRIRSIILGNVGGMCSVHQVAGSLCLHGSYQIRSFEGCDEQD